MQGAAPCGRFLRRKRTSRQHLFANGRLGISLFALRQGMERDGGRRRRRVDPRKFGIYGGPRRGRDSFDRTFIRDALAQTRVPAVPGRRGGIRAVRGRLGVFRTAFPKKKRFLKEKRLYEKSADGRKPVRAFKRGGGKIVRKKGRATLGAKRRERTEEGRLCPKRLKKNAERPSGRKKLVRVI